MLYFLCPSCDKKLGAPPEQAGRVSTCPVCQAKFQVPAPAIATPQAVLPPEYQNLPMANFAGGRPAPAIDPAFQNLPMASFAPGSGPVGPPSHADEPSAPAAKKKKRKKKGADLFGKRKRIYDDDDDGSGSPISLGQFAIALVLSLVLFGLVCRMFPDASIVVFYLGAIPVIGGALWCKWLQISFNPLTLIVPFLGLYIMVIEFEEFKAPLATMVMGFVIMIASLFGAFAR